MCFSFFGMLHFLLNHSSKGFINVYKNEKKKQVFKIENLFSYFLDEEYFYPLPIFSFNATKASKSPNVDFSEFWLLDLATCDA